MPEKQQAASPKTPPEPSPTRAQKAEEKEKKFTFEALLAGAHTLKIPRHVMIGTAAANNWKPGTRLTRKELTDGVAKWLRSPVVEEA